MKWITDENLKEWSRRTDARELFIDMVGDLIRATVSDVRKFRFPGQDSGTLRGFDGDLETSEAVSRVPRGHSKWEFGTTAVSKKKAQEDYDKRTGSTSEAIMADNALVLLNLHSWNTPRPTLVSWLEERNNEHRWREVHFIDGTALANWLEEKPAVAAKYARQVLKKAPRHGAFSTDEFWEIYSTGFKPTLTENMLLCERDKEAQQLLQALNGEAANYTLAAETAEEVIAFAIAAIREAPAELRMMLEAKTMIVETVEAAQHLLGMQNMIFLVWKGAEALAGTLGQRGPTLTAATGLQRNRPGRLCSLERPSASAMAEAMKSMNITLSDGHAIALKCGRSLTILRRLYPAAGIAPLAEWAHLATALKPALLAGGWTTDSDLDKGIVAGLAGGTDYVAVERPIRETLGMSDPPFDKVEQVWQIRAAVDAFYHYGHLVDENDLQRLKDAVVRVLGHQVAQPSADEKFSFSYRAPADYSSWLRDGLAYTLMLFAVMSDVGKLQLSGTTPQRYVDDVIRALPDFARNHRWILPILPQLSAVAEAAPVPFLEALERILEGQADDALNLFQEPTGHDFLFASTSPHVYVLWALEVLAWDPALLPRVTLVLGKLSAIDPGKESQNGNRPLSSLREIFLAWLPSTNADLNRRFIAIDGLINNLPDVAWELLLKLMPTPHDTSTSTARPKLRDTTPLEPESITFGLVWETETRVLDRVINLAQHEAQRVVSLVKYLGRLRPENQTRLVSLLEDNLKFHQIPEGSTLWHKLRNFIAHQEAFPDADWSLKGERLYHIKELLDQYRPSDPISLVRHLFDDWVPYTSSNPTTAVEDADTARVEALQKIYAELNIQGLLRLARTIKLPHQMGQALHTVGLSHDEAISLIFSLLGADGECRDLAFIISGNMQRRDGEAWAKNFTKTIVPQCASSKDIAQLISYWPNNPETWDFAKSLGSDIADTYWREFGSLPWQASPEVLQESIAELRRVHRSTKVLANIHKKMENLSSELLLSLLDECISELGKNDGTPLPPTYAISEIFTTLANRTDVAPLEVAKREYVYLPWIEDSVKGLSIHALLAESPSEYITLIKTSFVGKNEERDSTPSDEKRVNAKLAYRLLRSFHTIPGNKDGIIDEPTLYAWVVEVRRLAAECGREDITDEYIGQLLAHSPLHPTDETWPPQEVASVLEKISSEGIERGMMVERFNMRGVFTKAYHEGGAQERDLASRYRQWAAQATSPRTSAMLERIASNWDEDARRADVEAEQRKLKS
ncbi:MAG TPA: hypothetical protein VNS29_11320 [Burkholderiaceae bacterium]|nr:hypothetical protein [Burkholderiaceae bacterium]